VGIAWAVLVCLRRWTAVAVVVVVIEDLTAEQEGDVLSTCGMGSWSVSQFVILCNVLCADT